MTGVVVGAIAALYGAMGLGQALQNTQHVAWSVPRNSRPYLFYARVKTLLLLLTAGLSLLAVTIVLTIASTTDVFTEVIGDGIKGVLPVVTVLVVGTGLTYLFRFAATGQHSFWRAAPGGYTLAVLWQLLQIGGAAYVDRVLVNTSLDDQDLRAGPRPHRLPVDRRRDGRAGHRDQRRAAAAAVAASAAHARSPTTCSSPTPTARPTPSTPACSGTRAFEKVQVVWEPGPAEFKATDEEPEPEPEPQPESETDGVKDADQQPAAPA